MFKPIQTKIYSFMKFYYKFNRKAYSLKYGRVWRISVDKLVLLLFRL